MTSISETCSNSKAPKYLRKKSVKDDFSIRRARGSFKGAGKISIISQRFLNIFSFTPRLKTKQKLHFTFEGKETKSQNILILCKINFRRLSLKRSSDSCFPSRGKFNYFPSRFITPRNNKFINGNLLSSHSNGKTLVMRIICKFWSFFPVFDSKALQHHQEAQLTYQMSKHFNLHQNVMSSDRMKIKFWKIHFVIKKHNNKNQSLDGFGGFSLMTTLRTAKTVLPITI